MTSKDLDVDIYKEFRNAPKAVLLKKLDEAHKLIEMQQNVLSYYRECNKSGLMMTRQGIAALDVVFPGGLMESTDEIAKIFANEFRQVFQDGFSMLEIVAMSGSMRWPWSTEAKVSLDFTKTLNYL